ncbi:hypothetical protein [Paenibacillus sp. 598K]|uniref:hypothetical protein n=1 Tax=Paenibacillus sp. 598K TaxID=1117987 RepID=UPI000FFF4E48|nr:hypothetical protein [Paenibacillus sp. 598K]
MNGIVSWGITTGMTDWIWEEAILDTDFALKLEKVQKFNAIEKYIPLLVKKLYIHRYVYENEILMPKRTKDQIDKLIEDERAVIVDAEDLRYDAYKSLIYQQTIQHLELVDPETRVNGKNWGETVSVAFAFASGIPFILSDERELQELLNNELNSGTDKDILVIRLRDFIEAMKKKGLSRKEAYAMWCFAHQDERDREKMERAKSVFQNDIWCL